MQVLTRTLSATDTAVVSTVHLNGVGSMRQNSQYVQHSDALWVKICTPVYVLNSRGFLSQQVAAKLRFYFGNCEISIPA